MTGKEAEHSDPEKEVLRARVAELERESLAKGKSLAELAAKLEACEGHFFRLMESVPEMVSRHRPDGTFLYASPACTRLFGYAPEELLGRRVYDFIHPEDVAEVASIAGSAIDTGEARTVCCRLLTKGGGQVWVEATGRPIWGEGSEAEPEMVCVVRNVSAHMELERALQLRERQLAEAQALAHLGSWQVRFDAAGDVWTGSEELYRIYGNSPDVKMTMQTGFERIHPEDRERMRVIWAACLRKEGPSEWEHRIMVEGQVKWIQVQAQFRFDETGRPVEASGTNQDITERKLSEQTLEESERLARATLNALSWHIAILDEHGHIQAVNDSWRQFALANGALPERVCEGSDYLGVCGAARGAAAEDAQSFAEGIRAVLSGRLKTFGREYACHSPSEQRWFLGRVTRFPEDGSARVVVAHENITERRRTEELLRESERQYRELAESLSEVVYRADPDTLEATYVNRAVERLYGYTAEEWLRNPRLWLEQLHPEDKEHVLECVRESRRGGAGRALEYRILRKDGETRWVIDRYDWERNPDGTIVGQGGIVSDITERKRVEQALRESEERYRAVVEDQTEVITRFRSDGTFTFVNDVYCRFFGKRAEDLLGQKWQPMALSEDLALIDERLRAMSPENPVVVIENRVYSGSGKVHWMQFVNRGFYDEEGCLAEIQAVGREITERKRAEMALRESEERYRGLFDNGSDAILVFDGSTHRCEGANPAACRLYGYTLEEFLNMFAEDVSADLEKTRASLAAVVGEGVRETIPLRYHRKKDGSVFPAEISPAVYCVSGQPKIIGAVRDISERRRMEERLAEYQKQLRTLASDLAQTQDRERQRIAVFLHDQVGQSLAAVRMKFGVWKSMRPSRKRQALLLEIEEVIDQAIDDTRSLTFELSPPVLYELGLGPALEWIGETFCKEAGIAFEFQDDGRTGKIAEDAAGAIYRMARELMRNAVKHAHASRLSISLSRGRDAISLRVSDNGVGMVQADSERIFRPSSTAYGLFSVREQLRHRNGTLEIDTSPGAGTSARIVVPYPGAAKTGEGGAQ